MNINNVSEGVMDVLGMAQELMEQRLDIDLSGIRGTGNDIRFWLTDQAMTEIVKIGKLSKPKKSSVTRTKLGKKNTKCERFTCRIANQETLQRLFSPIKKDVITKKRFSRDSKGKREVYVQQGPFNLEEASHQMKLGLFKRADTEEVTMLIDTRWEK